MKRILTIFLLLLANLTRGQTGIGTDDPKAALDVVSTTEGILIPRMTAAQIEAIAAPNLGELVYTTTSDGAVISHAGFWYYDGTTWRPFSDNPSPPQNIYVINDTLTSDRTVNLNSYKLDFDTAIVSVHSASQRIGIGEAAPAATVDVNGNLRVRNLTEGNVVALADGTLANGPKVTYGTVKESLRDDDHNGWYKLDGRAISTLPAAAQANAASIGISGTLVNASNRLMKQGTPFVAGGSNTFTLARTHLPSFNMTGTAATSGAHTHSNTFSGGSMSYVANGALVVQTGGTAPGTRNVALRAAGAHSHSGSINSGGSGTPFNIVPESITFTYFIYLGQ